MTKNVLVLFSGGIDSTACINYYLKLGFDVKAVFIDYGQITSKKEFQSAKNIAEYYKISLDNFIFKNSKIFSQGEIKGRNAFFIFALLLNHAEFSGILSLGIHSSVYYYDCSEKFLKDIQKVLDGYTDGRIVLDAPFLKWDKQMIYDYCKANEIPIHLTYSCENGVNKPCGVCNSCKDRRTLNVS
ncbi:7-cyano-7-deazaguanine synthase [Methanobacterium formicicum]|uniref:7-cyano-7-deazaguanine synthase n=1 Tax=Methanobacterium formicicum (strain DSM 3637 / PP1) TaxID=1204725 RepID=K2RT14_METFP|nr:7-cyano-7-deazaguanine synthase [Methanobacterium formicicum]EKF85855.1 queuosine synthesis-like protein [Methanobacterium formicicum DSM 3637]